MGETTLLTLSFQKTFKILPETFQCNKATFATVQAEQSRNPVHMGVVYDKVAHIHSQD